jgi:hypothetical protein
VDLLVAVGLLRDFLAPRPGDDLLFLGYGIQIGRAGVAGFRFTFRALGINGSLDGRLWLDCLDRTLGLTSQCWCSVESCWYFWLFVLRLVTLEDGVIGVGLERLRLFVSVDVVAHVFSPGAGLKVGGAVLRISLS